MPQRTDRLGEQIKRAIGELILHGLKDSRIQRLTSITKLDLSNDHQHAKIFISVYGTEDEQQETLKGLQSATGFIKSEIAKRIRMKFTPNLYFILDDSIKKGMEVLDLLDKLKKEEQESTTTENV